MKKFALFMLLILPVLSFADEDICVTGKKQSPINITQVLSEELPPVNFIYQPIEMNVYHADYNILIKPQAELALDYEGKRYKLIEFHMHQPGEHTIDGTGFPLEIHYVHQAPDNHLIAVAQLFNVGKKNNSFQKLLVQMSLAKGQVGQTQIHFGYDPAELIAKHHDYYSYDGSLTYDPCSENVRWIVLKDSLEVSSGQIKALTDLIGYNSRIVQPTNGREIHSSVP